jgi:pimeloyl-ACP methyl ester carboxylesterase
MLRIRSLRRYRAHILLPALSIVFLFALQSMAHAQVQGPTYTKPLGIALDEYDYPYPVKFMPLEIEGQTLRMAYMDVPASATSNGNTVLLLHGKNFFGAYWAGTISALTAAGYRVVVPDQIGFGKSAKPDINYSFDLLAANTLKLLDQLRTEKVAVVGHSMGGMLAVRFARNYPERTTRLILENPIGLEDYRFKIPPQPIEKLYEKELSDTDPVKLRTFFRNYVVEWKPEVYEPFVQARIRVTLSGEYPRWAKSSALTYQMIYQQPVRHEFPLIKVPTLLVIGQQDRTTIGRGTVPESVIQTMGQYPVLGKEAARDIPGAKLVELNNVGHIPHLEAPDRFHAALLEFLK